MFVLIVFCPIVSALYDGHSVMVAHQPAFIMIPVNLFALWYSQKGLQILEELAHALTLLG